MPASTASAEARFDRPAQNLRHRLREETADSHARLDAALGASDLQSRTGYRSFLEANAAALLPIEDALTAARAVDLVPDWFERARSAAILGDLVQVGGAARRLPQPVFGSSGEILGALYVLEGSRLGAAYLLKAVSQSPDPVVARATAYLRHGEGQRLWPSFLSLLERHESQIDHADAVAGARRAFTLFEQAARA